jgi:excisionase family DNA binding protein
MTRLLSTSLAGPWLSCAAAAGYTGLSQNYLRQLVREDRVPHHRVGRRLLFSTPELDRWIADKSNLTKAAGAA